MPSASPSEPHSDDGTNTQPVDPEPRPTKGKQRHRPRHRLGVWGGGGPAGGLRDRLQVGKGGGDAVAGIGFVSLGL